MSTGLTYVWIADIDFSNDPTGTASFIFNDYSEAYNYGIWLGGFGGIRGSYVVFIWTSSPSQNGYWSGTPWEFTPQD